MADKLKENSDISEQDDLSPDSDKTITKEDTKDKAWDYRNDTYISAHGAEDFEELDAVNKTMEDNEQTRKDTLILPDLISNVMFGASSDEEKVPKVTSLLMQFVGRVTKRLRGEDVQDVFESKEIDSLVKELSNEDITGSDIAKILKQFKELDVENAPEEIQNLLDRENGNIMFLKEEDGVYPWIGFYSNNYRDVEEEIISEVSHERFEKMVDDGEFPLPKLLVWHIPEAEIGEATMVAYNKETGTALAAGYTHKDKQAIVENVIAMEIDWAMSHGMPKSSVKKSTADKSIYVEHQTEEITILPLKAAANKLTSWSFTKEINMNEDKKDLLKGLGFDADDIEAKMKENKSLADDLGLETKEDKGDGNGGAPIAEDKTPSEDAAADTESNVDKKEVVLVEGFTKEQTDALGGVLKSFGEIVNKSIEQSEARILERIEAGEKIEKEKVDNLPPATLADMLFPGRILKDMSAVSSDSTKLDGRTREAKQSGPLETKEDAYEGDLFAASINDILTDNVLGDKE